jgi:hypothetical protein
LGLVLCDVFWVNSWLKVAKKVMSVRGAAPNGCQAAAYEAMFT